MIHQACGAPAFLADHRSAVLGTRPDLNRVAHVDGRPILAAETAVCDSCGATLRDLSTETVRPEVVR